MKGTDTLTIEKYTQGQRVFWKSYLADGCNISIRKYDGKDLTTTIWFKTHKGFVINDYLYDKKTNSRLTYSYESKQNEKTEAGDLCLYQNTMDVQKSKPFKTVYLKKNRFLQEITFLRDSFFTKKIQFDSNGDTIKITTYSFENNRLKKARIINVKDSLTWNHMWDNIYSYDNNGNELQCLNVRNGTDTTSAVNKTYNNNLLIEEEYLRNKKLESLTKYEYSNSLLVKKIENIGKYDDPSVTNYSYNEDRTLKRIDNYLGWSYYYFYE